MSSYKEAGVDLEKADRFTDYIKEKVKRTFGRDIIGSFAGGLALKGYQKPVLFTSTDGVGTKLMIAQEMGVHNTVGIDLVAMNVNDVITTGAKPFLFLDYIATGRIEIEVLKEVIDGIVEGCKRAECFLAGGETAEMPGFYPEGVYDLAGFCIGVCEEEEVIDTSSIEEGDILIGIPSSGFHSNGYSLIRKVLRDKNISLSDHIEELGAEVGEVLLKPTRIYSKEISELRSRVEVKGLAHITGGGIPGNLIRILPEGKRAVIDKGRLPIHREMVWIQEEGTIPEEEMLRTFNMGIGMIAVLDSSQVKTALEVLKDAVEIGAVEKGKRGVEFTGTFQS